MGRWVYQTAKAILDAGKFPILLGGQHTVSLGSIRRAAEAFDDLTVLSLDAHADMRNEYEGNPFSHACVMRRCLDLARPVLAGVRSLSMEEYQFLSETDVPLLTAREFLHDERALNRILQALSPRVYLSVDFDVFDPSEMPCARTPEPGGLRWRHVLRIIRRAADEKKIVAADFVELSHIPVGRAVWRPFRAR